MNNYMDYVGKKVIAIAERAQGTYVVEGNLRKMTHSGKEFEMGFEKKVIESFKKAKEDAEGIKNELAFALKRIARIEEILNKQAIEDLGLKENLKKKR